MQISEGVSVRRAPESFTVENSVVSKAKKRKEQPDQDPIIAVKPEGCSGPITVVGVLREKEKKADPIKSLKLPGASSMASAFLGDLSKGKWGKVTLHEPSASKSVLHSYTIWAKTEELMDTKNTKGVTIWAEIEPYFIAAHSAIWICRYYEVMG